MRALTKRKADQQLMLVPLRAAIESFRNAALLEPCTTLQTAIRFEKLFGANASTLIILGRCYSVIDIFCTVLVKGNTDGPFRDAYTRDLTFRKTWLDFLASLLTYIELLNASEALLTKGECSAFMLQKRTAIENARKRLHVDMKKASQSKTGIFWLHHNKRRRRALSMFKRSGEDADTLHNMRDMLNEL